MLIETIVVFLAKEERGHQNPRPSVSRCTASSSTNIGKSLDKRDVRHSRRPVQGRLHHLNRHRARRLGVLRKTNADIEIGIVLRHTPSSSSSPRRSVDIKTLALLFRDVRHPRRLGVLRVNACSARSAAHHRGHRNRHRAPAQTFNNPSRPTNEKICELFQS